MQLTSQTFSISGFIKPDHSIVLKSVEVEKGSEGMVPVGRYGDAVDLKPRQGKFGTVLLNPLPEEDRANFDSYFIGSTNPDNRGAKRPVAVLHKRLAGSEESEFICGLFLKEREGNYYLSGTDVENKRRYGVFLNREEATQKIAVNQ